MEKEGLRLIYRDKRSKLSNEQQLLFHQQLTDHFFAGPRIVSCLAKSGAIVHTYLPIRRQYEVDTWPLIDQLWRDFPTVRTWSSVPEPKNRVLRHFQLTVDTSLTESPWGIPVPSGAYEPVSGQPDLVIVPLLAFDRVGHRVGYGGGYYDRFLAATGPKCLKIGLSHFEPVECIRDVEETDIRLDGCITPEKPYWFL